MAKIEAAAESWVGTPFCENSCIKGGGVSCHLLPAEIYFEAGAMERIPIPEGSAGWASSQNTSLMVDWVERSGLFEEVKTPAAGDLLGFRLGHVVHHMGVMLSGGRMVHAVRTHGVQIASNIPGGWSKRLEKIWRLK